MKKFLTYSVVIATIVWSLGLAAVVPSALAAYTPVAGDLVKAAGNPPVFYINSDLKRVYFPDEATFFSWYAGTWKSFNLAGATQTVKTITAADLQAIPLASPANLVVRPGNLIKIGGLPTVYALGANGKRCAIGSADVAKAFFGTNWAAKVVKVNAYYEADYGTVDASCALTSTSSKLPDGFIFKSAGSADVYFLQNGQKRKLTAEGFTANGFRSSMIATANAADYTSGSDITAKDAGILTLTTGTATTPVSTGSVSVSLASDTPASANVADGTAFNPVLKVNISAGSSAASITGFTLKKSGFAANTAVSGVDVVDQSGKRYGNVASSVNSDNEVNLIFSSDPINIAAGQTVSLTFRVNLADTANSGTLQFSLASASAVVAGGSVSGSFPVTGNTLTIIDGANSLATVTIDEQPVNATGATLNIDASSAQDIAKFRVSETSGKEGINVKGLTLYNNGNATDVDYKDVELVAADGTVLASAQPKGQYVSFAGLNYFIDKGLSKDLTVRAKIVSGTTRTIQFTVYNNYDLSVIGNSTNSYVLPGAGSNDTSFPIGDSTSSYNKVTVGSGTVIFSKDSTSPNVAVAPGTNNTVLAKFAVKANGEDVELRTATLGIVKSAGTALTGSVYVKVNDSSVWSDSATAVNGTASGASITLQSYPTLKSGVTSYITVVGSVSSNATSGDAYKVYLDLNNVKRLSTNDIIDAGVAIDSGNLISVQAAALKVTTLSTPVSQTTVNGNDFEFANFELNANNSGEDVKVSSITISDILGDDAALSQITNLRIYQGATLLETSNSTANAAASTTFNFKSPITITKGSSVTLRLVANISNAADADGNTDDSHTFSIASGNVTAIGASTGNSITGSSLTVAGSGQAIKLATTGSATASLVSGANASPSSDQLINVGTTDGTYFAFKLTANNENLKMRTIKLTATSSASTKLAINDLRNIRLYANGTQVASANQMDSCAAGVCTVTFTSSDNIFGQTLVGTANSTAVNVVVKADLGAAGIAKLGDNFRFYIASSTTDLVGVGAISGNSATITGTPTVTAVTYINPFVVSVAGVSPTSPVTVGTSAGINVGTFKVTNSGSAPITLTQVKFTDNGSATSSKVYHLYASADGGSASDGSAATGGTATSTSATFTTSMTINGGSSRYLTVKMDNLSSNNDTYQLSANAAVGDFTFSVSESDLGYDANGDGDRSDTSTGLGVVGNPTVETVTAKN